MSQLAPGPVRQKRKRLVSEKHRRFVAAHLCVACNEGHLSDAGPGHCQAAHVSYLGKKFDRPRGKGQKVDDFFTVPLGWRCHHDQGHWQGGEEAWWKHIGLDPEPIALELARNSPDPKIRAAVEQFEKVT